jgi:hypothetical protein
LIHLSIFSSRSAFERLGFLYEFKDVDLPNGIQVVALFVLSQSKGLESRVITKRGDFIAATERADA